MAMSLAEWLSVVGRNYDDPVVIQLRKALGLAGKGPRVDTFGAEEVPAEGVAIMLARTAAEKALPACTPRRRPTQPIG
jgi:hypothetical protein